MCHKDNYPLRLPEFNAYSDIIDELYSQFGGTHFYDYHNLFSRKVEQLEAAGHLVKWDCKDTKLYLKLFAGLRGSSCQHCGCAVHESNFCPSLAIAPAAAIASPPVQAWSPNSRHSWTPRAATFGPMPSSIGSSPMSNSSPPNPIAPTMDLPRASSRVDDRPRQYHNGKEICINFNTKGCNYVHTNNSKIVHICSKCFSSNHSAKRCPSHRQ